MTVQDIVSQLNLTVCSGQEGLQREVKGGYTSDLLSDVMGHAQEGDVWVTLQTHKNVMAIASLKEIAAIILVKGHLPEEDTLEEIARRVSPSWNPDDMAYGLNRLAELCYNDTEVLQQFYTDEEKNEDPEKKNTALFWFPTGKKAPFAISIAGGGYNGVCSLMEGFPVAAKLNEMGINAFVLDYRAGTDDAADKSEEDLHRAIQFIFENKERFQLEDSYAVVGFSAGGHLTAEFGTDNRGYKTADLPKPEMLGLGYACVNLEFTEEEKKQQLSEDMFGKNREKEYYIAKRNEFTVLDHISSNYPPAFIWHTMEDELIPYEDNAVAMKEILDCVGVRNQLKCVKHGLHGLGLGTGSEAQGWLEEAVAFWKNQK